MTRLTVVMDSCTLVRTAPLAVNVAWLQRHGRTSKGAVRRHVLAELTFDGRPGAFISGWFG